MGGECWGGGGSAIWDNKKKEWTKKRKKRATEAAVATRLIYSSWPYNQAKYASCSTKLFKIRKLTYLWAQNTTFFFQLIDRQKLIFSQKNSSFLNFTSPNPTSFFTKSADRIIIPQPIRPHYWTSSNLTIITHQHHFVQSCKIKLNNQIQRVSLFHPWQPPQQQQQILLLVLIQ